MEKCQEVVQSAGAQACSDALTPTCANFRRPQSVQKVAPQGQALQAPQQEGAEVSPSPFL